MGVGNSSSKYATTNTGAICSSGKMQLSCWHGNIGATSVSSYAPTNGGQCAVVIVKEKSCDVLA